MRSTKGKANNMAAAAKQPAALLGAAVLAIGMVLLALGILRGETTEIMRKAVVICLECIGIG